MCSATWSSPSRWGNYVRCNLLFAKRLVGLRGGGKAERAEHEADIGSTAIERAIPRTTPE